MAGVMMLLTTPILLCSTPGPTLNSKEGAGNIAFTKRLKKPHDCAKRGEIQFQKKVTQGFEIFRVPWSQAKYPIHAQSSAEEVFNAGKSHPDSQTRCSLTCANPNFSLRTDGMCKAPHEASLAIAVDGLAALCPEAMAGLAQFLMCGLKQEIEILRNADFSSPSVSMPQQLQLK
ncbi:hypothetical protein PoB_003670600 [Plakobranchus ocellatus]|uniref:Uncharacterized protein n=1 Tax=Plakobranchus ocellatus TaxID=259542 RepID=A0AAV4AUI1_9GAST|nr:hypothetical protein PoB_003670600 [Plakobranchus ocellatus]